MGLFTLPPKIPQADLNLDLFLKGDNLETTIRRPRRTLAAEWFPQSGIQLTWPHAGTDWAEDLPEVTACYLRMAFEIAMRETLLVVTPEVDEVRTLLQKHLPRQAMERVALAECPTNDTWARDHSFLTVLGTNGPELLDFRFNGWGGKFEAQLDNAINRNLYENGWVKGTYIDCLDFELEGGSIETDGCGTLLTTTRCLLNPNRGHGRDKQQIELLLGERLGVNHFLWLEHGELIGDDTDAHIDTLARLCPEQTIVYTQSKDPEDPQHKELDLMEKQLQSFRTAENEPYRLIPLPVPDPVWDENGERLPATYANFLVMNEVVLYPTYRQPEKDETARQALLKAFPRLDLVGIDCRVLIRQHGSLHCATMQYPRGVLQQK